MVISKGLEWVRGHHQAKVMYIYIVSYYTQKERVKIKLSQALIKYADDPSENNNAIIQLYEDVLTDIEDEMATLIREL